MQDDGKAPEGAAAAQDRRPDGSRVTLRGRIDGTVIDVNGHMNVSGFDLLFDRAEHNLFQIAGIWEPWIEARRQSLFRLEKLIRYERELLAGDPFEVRSRVLATDGRRIHHFHELWHCALDRRSACFDGLSIHVDLTARKSAPVSDPEVLRLLLALRDEAADAPRPDGVVARDLARRTLSPR